MVRSAAVANRAVPVEGVIRANMESQLSKTAAVPATVKSNIPQNYNYGSEANLGFEGTSSEDFSIPFLGLLQSNSPMVEQNENARMGMIVNTVTGDLFKANEGVAFIPVATKHNYIEWHKRDSGQKGFVAEYDLDDPFVVAGRRAVKFGKLAGKQPTTELTETFTVFGIAVYEDGTTGPVAISFTSTKIKKYKGWMTKAKSIQIPTGDGRRIPAPLMAHRYRLKSVNEKNSKGSFANWDISFDGANALECRLSPEDPLFQEAVDLNKMVVAGIAKANHAAAGDTEGAPQGDTSATADDEIPF